MASISRRTFAAFLATAALTPVLGGCSPPLPAPLRKGRVPRRPMPAASAATRTVDTDKGPVEIPTNLQTIVSDYYLGEFLAVDVKPGHREPLCLEQPLPRRAVRRH